MAVVRRSPGKYTTPLHSSCAGVQEENERLLEQLQELQGGGGRRANNGQYRHITQHCGGALAGSGGADMVGAHACSMQTWLLVCHGLIVHAGHGRLRGRQPYVQPSSAPITRGAIAGDHHSAEAGVCGAGGSAEPRQQPAGQQATHASWRGAGCSPATFQCITSYNAALAQIKGPGAVHAILYKYLTAGFRDKQRNRLSMGGSRRQSMTGAQPQGRVCFDMPSSMHVHVPRF